MPLVGPFRGLVYDPEVVGPLEAVTAPPYDVISDRQRRELLAASPWAVVHLDLAEGEEDPAHPERRYERAAALLAAWKRRGALREASGPAYHVYEMSTDEVTIVGVVCALELEDWGPGVIPHERTLPGPIRDRLALLRAIRTHLSPVYATIAGPCAPLGALCRDATETPPIGELIDQERVRHRLWSIAPDAPVDRWLRGEPILIADGHHRYQTALAYRDERRASDGDGPWDRVLTFVVDAGSQPVPVLPFHRIQSTGAVLRGGTPAPDPRSALDQVSDDEVGIVVVSRDGGAGIRVRSVRLPGPPPAVRALHAAHLDRIDPTSIRYTPDADAAIAAVASGDAVAAYLLPRITAHRVREVIGSGERLPQKSTYFWPKPRTGMVMMPI